MPPQRILIYGNAGSGKTTMATQLAAALHAPVLALDDIAWLDAAVRRPVEASIAELRAFIRANEQWVIEGCYGDLIDAALPHCTELRFVNPGVEACVARCRERAWEPDKFETPEAQDAMLETLIGWVRQYETRDDEFSLTRHRAIFDAFTGVKREYA